MVLEIREEAENYIAQIRVIGVGGAGIRVINRMMEEEICGVEYVGIDADAQTLEPCKASRRIRMDKEIAKGWDPGQDKEGQKAERGSAKEIADAVKDADMVFVIGGMEGSAGADAISAVAQIAREQGIDALIEVSEDKLLESAGLAVLEIANLLNTPEFVNLSFTDVQMMMKNKGAAHIGIGSAKGEDKARKAAKLAVQSLLSEGGIAIETGIIMYISGAISLIDLKDAVDYVQDVAGNDTHIIFGALQDETMEDASKVTVIAIERKD